MKSLVTKAAIATTIVSAVGVSAVIDSTAQADSVVPTQGKTPVKKPPCCHRLANPTGCQPFPTLRR